MNELRAEYSGRATVEIIDVDDPANYELVRQYSVQSIPRTVVLASNGSILGNHHGLTTKDTLRRSLDAAIDASS